MGDTQMEDLLFNDKSEFTRWIVQHGLLGESFVVVDVGVQGGAHPRWNLLDGYLIFHGFDAIAEVIAELTQINAGRSNRHFHNLAIGDADCERTFYVNVLNPTSSSMFMQGVSRFEGERSEEARLVPLHRLDTLFADGRLPRADFLKVDVEGFEKYVLLGAKSLLSSGVLGVETESNFNISPIYPKSHFTALSDILVEQGLILADIGFNRVPRANFVRVLQQSGVSDREAYEIGRPATLNLLFCRDPIGECDQPQSYTKLPNQPNVDQIIKTIMIYELYGLNDIALDIAERFTEALGSRIDVARAMHLLVKADCRQVPTVPDISANTDAEVARLQLQLRESTLQVSTLHRQLSDKALEVSTLQQQQSDAALEVATLQQQLSDAAQKLCATEQQLEAVRRSSSWRLTAPLRKTKNLGRGVWASITRE